MNPTTSNPTAGAMDPATVPYAGHVQRAAAALESGKARLFRDDGEPVYSPQEHNSRLGDLLAQYDTSVGAVIGLQETDALNAETTLTAVQRDPVLALDTTDAARAGALQPFMREDFETL